MTIFKVNPLGASRGKHKVVQLFFCLAEMPKAQRSQIDRLQLGLIVKEKILKKYGYSRIYKKLLHDLRMLETGIEIGSPPRLVKCGVLLHVADNLEAHEVGGFSTCFSSKSVCRWCHIQYGELQSRIHDFAGLESHGRWTVEEYDAIVSKLVHKESVRQLSDTDDDLETADVTNDNVIDDLEYDLSTSSSEGDESDREDDENAETFGLRMRCPFNELQTFHSVTSFVPDVMHDLMEGVIPQDLLGVIRILSLKGWFNIEDYNMMLGKICSDSRDSPHDIPGKSAKKLVGKAVSHWVHIRSFGMIIKDFVVDLSDSVLALGLKLIQITERITASRFRLHEIDILEEKILEYLDCRNVIFEEYPFMLGSAKPKHHYMVHYAESIRAFGPPLAYWTAKYESKHRIAKNTAENAKNFINISATIAERQQLL